MANGSVGSGGGQITLQVGGDASGLAREVEEALKKISDTPINLKFLIDFGSGPQALPQAVETLKKAFGGVMTAGGTGTTGSAPNASFGNFYSEMDKITKKMKDLSSALDDIIQTTNRGGFGGPSGGGPGTTRPVGVPGQPTDASPVPGGTSGGSMMAALKFAAPAALALNSLMNMPFEQAAAGAARGTTTSRTLGAATSFDISTLVRLGQNAAANSAGDTRMAQSYLSAGLGGAAAGALIGSAFLPGIGTIAGGVIGGVAGIGMNYASGRAERSYYQGFEEMMGLNEKKYAGSKPYIEAARLTSRRQFDLQKMYGMSNKQAGGYFGNGPAGSGTLSDVIDQYKFSTEEAMGGTLALGRFGGSGPNSGLLKQMARLARGTGTSIEQQAAQMSGFSGAAGGNLAGQSQQYEDVLARAVARGYDNSETSSRFMATVGAMSQAAGNGYGAVGTNVAANMIANAGAVVGMDASFSAGQSFMRDLNRQQTSRGGISGMANVMAVGQELGKVGGLTGPQVAMFGRRLEGYNVNDLLDQNDDPNSLVGMLSQQSGGTFTGKNLVRQRLIMDIKMRAKGVVGNDWSGSLAGLSKNDQLAVRQALGESLKEEGVAGERAAAIGFGANGELNVGDLGRKGPSQKGEATIEDSIKRVTQNLNNLANSINSQQELFRSGKGMGALADMVNKLAGAGWLELEGHIYAQKGIYAEINHLLKEFSDNLHNILHGNPAPARSQILLPTQSDAGKAMERAGTHPGASELYGREPIDPSRDNRADWQNTDKQRR